MRKPLVALGLALSTGLGTLPAAGALAATSVGTTSPHSSSPRSSSPGSSYTSTSYPTASPNVAPNTVSGTAIVEKAMQYLGYPYTATGGSPSTGFSCIGLVSYVYNALGIHLPGDLADALAYAPQVSFAQLEPGDILYFQNTVWNGLSHAAIYIGGGKFIHAEWYGKGVRISSFNNDPSDGNYWIGHYMTANRPWGGAAGAAVLPPQSATGTVTPPSTPTATGIKPVANGPTALVGVSSLNVRSGPSMQHSVQEVVTQGTSLVILGKQNGWYKVQLPDGTIGWVIGAGIGQGSTPSTPSPSTTATGANGLVGNPTAPKQIVPTTPRLPQATASVAVSALNVHSGPALSAPVVSSVSKGQRLVVLARRNGWVEVRLPNGSTGWIDVAYTHVRKPAQTANQVAAIPRVSAPARTAGAAVNVRSGPSFTSTVITTLSPGQSYRILGWSNGWARVQLANGATGWMSGTVVGSRTPVTAPSRTQTATRPALTATVTAAVNVRSGPSMSNGVIVTLSPGQSYQILGWSNGWAHVRLANGSTGWISGTVLGSRPQAASPHRSASTSVTSKPAASTSAAGAVLTAGVRVHASPGISAPVVSTAAAGTHVSILGWSRGWALVRLPSGQSGYVLGSFVHA